MDLLLRSDLVIKNSVLAEDLIIEGNWRYRQELMTQYAHNGELYITRDLYLRRIVYEPREKTLKDLLPRVGDDDNSTHKTININNLFADGWGSNEDGEEELRQLLGHKAIMDFPKPRKLLEKLAVSIRDDQSLILDFFAGSCPVAHATYDLNKEDGGNRKYIMVQLPEPCDEKSEAYKAGYRTIAEIGKERLRRAAKKIKDENPMFAGDLGFRAFKLDTSNIRAWEPDRDDLERTLLDNVDHIKSDRSEEDILYELLLKLGLDLCAPIEARTIAGKSVRSINAGALIACLDKTRITADEAEPLALGIAEWRDDLAPAADSILFFRDSAFADDVAKTNLAAILQQRGLGNVRSL